MATTAEDGGVDSSDATVDAPTSAVIVLAAEQPSPTGIAVDATHFFVVVRVWKCWTPTGSTTAT